MANHPDLAALLLTPDQLGDLLGRLARGSHGVTLCGMVRQATHSADGVQLHLQDALLHLGPAPAPSPPATPEPQA